MIKHISILMPMLLLFHSANSQRPDTLKIDSKFTTQEQEVWVTVPDGYDTLRNLPVIIYLDADGLSQLISPFAHYLSRPFDRSIPPVMTIGIRSKSPSWRRKYFVPYNKGDTISRADNDRADDMLAFIEQEMLPLIMEKYKAGNTRVLVGHSLAGLFALYMMNKKPDLFDAYVVVSPSPNRGLLTDGILSAILKNGQSCKKYLHFSVSGNDLEGFEGSAVKANRMLQSSDTGLLKWRYKYYEDYNHWTVVPPAIYDAMVWCFRSLAEEVK